jgi:hypothetical protein
MISFGKEEAPQAYCTYVEEADDSPGIRRAALPTKLANDRERIVT